MFVSTRLLLKPITYKNIRALLQILNDPLVSKYNDYGSLLTLEEVKAMVQADLEQHYLGTGCRLGIYAPENELIGSVGLYDYDKVKGVVKIGFELSPKYWRQGLMREALQMMFEYIPQLIRIKHTVHIIAVVHPQNTASIHLLERLGFSCDSNGDYVVRLAY